MSNHGEQNIGDPRATFGITEGNPLWEELRDIALRAGPSFLINVTLNETRQITGVFAGDLIKAHKEGYEFVRQSAMQAVEAPFDIVVTTNSGFPLDLNLYQGVKGMSAGARILKEQWQAQIQALIQRRAEVQVYSSLDANTIKGAHLIPCQDISETVAARLKTLPPDARVAVLPQGPLTIPYLV